MLFLGILFEDRDFFVIFGISVVFVFSKVFVVGLDLNLVERILGFWRFFLILEDWINLVLVGVSFFVFF